MTLFEYLSVAFSIVVSLSAAQLLGGLRAALRPGGRYWVHLCWMGLTLFAQTLLWWEFWAYQHVASWSLGAFLLVLVNPGLYFLGSTALVDADDPPTADWERHYFQTRGYFFVPFALVLPVSFLRDWQLLGIPFSLPKNLPELLLASICVICWRSSDRRVHAILTIVMILLTTAAAASVWLQPGGSSQLID